MKITSYTARQRILRGLWKNDRERKWIEQRFGVGRVYIICFLPAELMSFDLALMWLEADNILVTSFWLSGRF